jgi:hypothetical protein
VSRGKTALNSDFQIAIAAELETLLGCAVSQTVDLEALEVGMRRSPGTGRADVAGAAQRLGARWRIAGAAPPICGREGIVCSENRDL